MAEDVGDEGRLGTARPKRPHSPSESSSLDLTQGPPNTHEASAIVEIDPAGEEPPKSFALFSLPAELRSHIYELFSYEILDIYHNRDAVPRDRLRGFPNASSRARAGAAFLPCALACRQMHKELQEVFLGLCRVQIRLRNCVRRTPTPLTRSERMETAVVYCRQCQVVGCLQGISPATRSCQYSVLIVFSWRGQRKKRTYELRWVHATEAQIKAAGLTQQEYDRMVYRVNWAISHVVRQRELLDGVKGLDVRCMDDITNAFYFDEREV